MNALQLLQEIYDSGYLRPKLTSDETGLQERIEKFLSAPKHKVAAALKLLPEVTWDRWAGDLHEFSMFFGWIERDDGRSDFVVAKFEAGDCWSVTTSSAKHSEEFTRKLLGNRGDGHSTCKRIENDFEGVNAVKLNPYKKLSDAIGEAMEGF